jgi:ribosome-associated toxin RatA of RatAB toxin-antitoxin module
MPTFNATALIAASSQRVWPVMADVARWPEWLPTVTAVQALGPSPLAVGGRYRVLQPKLRPAIWSVVELEPQTRFSWESRAPGVRILADHILTPTTGAATSVTLQVVVSGPLSGWVGLIAGRLAREYLEREAAALKQRVESAVGHEPRVV